MSTEVRGEWPGGIETDPNTGHSKFEVVVGATPVRDGHEVVRPVWACRLCAKKLKHTEADHDLFVTLGRRNRIGTRP